MKGIIFILFLIFYFFDTSKAQSNDTLLAKILWIEDLKDCLLIGVASPCNITDTTVLMSPSKKNINPKKRRRIQVGQIYILAVEKDIVIASPTKDISVAFKNTIVWTNKEPYKLKPRLCLNCIDEYVK